jgi:hypothetical protein
MFVMLKWAGRLWLTILGFLLGFSILITSAQYALHVCNYSIILGALLGVTGATVGIYIILAIAVYVTNQFD